MSEVTTKEKLASARRELALRRNVYPRFVSSGKLSHAQATHELRVMEAIVQDYESAENNDGN